jgi:hypothetical protein
MCRIVGIIMELYQIKLTTTAASMNERVASLYVSSAFKLKIPNVKLPKKREKSTMTISVSGLGKYTLQLLHCIDNCVSLFFIKLNLIGINLISWIRKIEVPM